MKNILWIFICLIYSGSILASEKSLYNFSWLDKDKEIYVLQNRLHRKEGKFYVGATGVKTVNGAFIDSYGGTLRGGYFFREDWGVELIYGKNTGSESTTAQGVREQGTFPYYRKIDSHMGAMAMWSPFYSKINTFNKIFYFDWMFGLGLDSIRTLDNRNRFDISSTNPDVLTPETNLGVIWNTGFRFYVNDHWSIRFDVTSLNYNAQRSRKVNTTQVTTKTFYSNYDFGLGLNYSF